MLGQREGGGGETERGDKHNLDPDERVGVDHDYHDYHDANDTSAGGGKTERGDEHDVDHDAHDHDDHGDHVLGEKVGEERLTKVILMLMTMMIRIIMMIMCWEIER